MRKKIVLSMLFFVLILSITACSVSTESGNEQAAEPTETAESTETTGTDSEETSEEPAVEALEEGEYHIGVITGTASQGEDELRAAEFALEKYGSANDGGMIVHDTYPDNFMNEQETTISKIVAMADDPQMKAIVVNQSVPGTVAAFQQVRERRPDILLINLTPQEDVLMVESASDLVIDADNIARGYRIIAAAKEMGATKFAHISFPRHMSIEMLALRKAIMEAACEELGLEFIELTAPDPTSDVGIPGAQQFIAENIPNWIETHGQDTAFFCTNDAHTEPLLRGIAAGGALFVEQDLPSPIMGYPGAFSIDLSEEAGDWEAINNKVEEAVVSAGGEGKMGSWAYSLGYTTTLAGIDIARGVIEGNMDINNPEDLAKALGDNSSEGIWIANNYVDRNSGEEVENHILISQDTYVYGRGYLGMTDVEVPEEYLLMNVSE